MKEILDHEYFCEAYKICFMDFFYPFQKFYEIDSLEVSW